jgi:asparagine synthase (glutamine-hydrolysing)
LCGIAGFTHGNRVLNSSHIRSAVRALIHRGPDQQGIFESHDVSLGAVRLKIIDLAGGDQPMISEDGDIVLAFNGEIYNHAELRAELLARGWSFISNSDTEVVLQAFREWDIGCFRRFRGMFAVALWTDSQKRLVLARDRLGIKPLFFHRTGSDILFGSEIKAILEHPAVERRINIDALNCFLSLNYVPAPHAMIDGIEKLLPGHFIEWVDGKTQMAAYWGPTCHPRKWTLEDAKEELNSLLRQSVREHLISDVPLGIWFSGGLDSSTLVHYAAELGAHLKTFSITFKGRNFDESRYIEEVSRKYGTEHSEFDLNTDLDLTGAVERFAYHSDEPCADAGALPVWFLAKECRKDVTVALSGEGADELFGGYVTYLADRYSRWFRQVPPQLRRAGWSVLRRWPVSDEKISLEYKLKRFFQGSFMPPEQAHVFWNGTFTEQEKSRFFLEADGRPVQTLLSQMPKQDGLNRYLAFDVQFYLPDDILCKVDRMSMAHSLEVRPPFLDHRICEFALSLPEDLKIRRSQLKFLLRVLMRRKLPASILRRKKIGFDIPAHDWLRGALRPLLLDTVTENAVRETGLFRWHGIEAILKEHLDRRANWGYHLWGLMILLLWMKQWKIHQADLSLSRSLPPSSSVASTVHHI